MEFHAYWNNEEFVRTNDEKFRVSFWTRPHPDHPDKKKVMMMVMNMHYKKENNRNVKITIHPERLNLPDDWSVRNLETMPSFVKREKVLDRLDRETNRGFGEIEEGPGNFLSDDLLMWRNQDGYDWSKLDEVSDGNTSFTLEVPGRDFVTILIR